MTTQLVIVGQQPVVLSHPLLATQEAIIEQGIEAWRAVGLALDKIKRERLYKPQYHSFSAYCRDRWKISSQEGYRRIAASLVAEKIDPEGQILHNEWDARQLAQELTGQEYATAATLANELENMSPEQLMEVRAKAEAKLLDPIAEAKQDFEELKAKTSRLGQRYFKNMAKIVPEFAQELRAQSERGEQMRNGKQFESGSKAA